MIYVLSETMELMLYGDLGQCPKLGEAYGCAEGVCVCLCIALLFLLLSLCTAITLGHSNDRG